MKKTLFSLLLLMLSIAGFAQCEKKILFSSSKTEHIKNDTVLRTQDETTMIVMDKSSLILTINGEDRGTLQISSQTCDWKIPFKEGKSIIAGSFEDGTFDIVIEGKDGKVYLTAKKRDSEGNPIRMLADKFEEVI